MRRATDPLVPDTSSPFLGYSKKQNSPVFLGHKNDFIPKILWVPNLTRSPTFQDSSRVVIENSSCEGLRGYFSPSETLRLVDIWVDGSIDDRAYITVRPKKSTTRSSFRSFYRGGIPSAFGNGSSEGSALEMLRNICLRTKPSRLMITFMVRALFPLMGDCR